MFSIFFYFFLFFVIFSLIRLDEIVLTEKYKKIDNDNLLLFNTEKIRESDTIPIIYGFATDEFFKILCRSEKNFMDGTFSTSPKLFTQLYTIHALYNGQMTPLRMHYCPIKKQKRINHFLI